MRPLHEILLPTDFSPRSVARYFSSQITLLHVLPPVNLAFAAFGRCAMLDEMLPHQNEETCDELNSYFSNELRGVSVKRIVSEGDPAEIIPMTSIG